jgi:hypothetical protein
MSATAKTVKKGTATAKTAKTAKKRSTAAKAVKKQSKAQVRPIDVSPEERRRMIDESAYLRAEQRGFADGDPVTDWLRSEREIDKVLARRTK